MKGNSLIKAAKILALVSLFALVSACGGGGGSSTPAETACTWDSTNWNSCNWQ